MPIALGCGTENVWELFCALVGHPELIDDPRFATPGLRTRNHAALEPILKEGLRRRTTAGGGGGGGPPVIGRHTREVLAGLLGLSEADVEAEFARGAAVAGEDIPAELTEA